MNTYINGDTYPQGVYMGVLTIYTNRNTIKRVHNFRTAKTNPATRAAVMKHILIDEVSR